MNHLMIDIETLGVHPGSVVLEIGMIPFDLTGKMDVPYVMRINIQNSIDLGFSFDSDTMKWWLENYPDLIKDHFMNDGYKDARWVMNDVRQYIDSIRNTLQEGTRLYLWSCYPQFDFCKLKEYFKKTGVSVPWEFYEEFDYATIVNSPLFDDDQLPQYDTKHRSLDDCRDQIKLLCEAFSRLDSGLL